MGKYQSIFKRYEKKYRICNEDYINLKKELDKYMTEDKYGEYTICNLYYDTDCYEIIRRSLEKPVYKEKLRVRSYGIPDHEDDVFFELKKKYQKEVFKRRISLPYKSYQNYIIYGIVPQASKQILAEIKWFMDIYKPYPRMFIAYDRLALFGNENKNVRVTFDQNIRFRTNNLCLMKGDQGEYILDYGERIMEIKVEGAMPLWLSNILNKCSILPTSFSKYGECYKRCILEHSPRKIKKKII